MGQAQGCSLINHMLNLHFEDAVWNGARDTRVDLTGWLVGITLSTAELARVRGSQSSQKWLKHSVQEFVSEFPQGEC
jgi:hypothetical protein